MLPVIVLVVLVLIIFWPRAGLWAIWRRYLEDRGRHQAEDALKHLHTYAWRGGIATLDSLAGALRLSSRAAVHLAARLESQGLLHSTAEGLRLTPAGEQLALQVIRAHRLWERYLADEARMPLAAIHAEAERREHDHAAEALRALDAALGYPATDPHGDPIPTAQGQLARTEARPITEWPLHTPARIVHLEDEPAVIFAQIAAQGLRLGQVVRVIESDPRRLVLSDGEQAHRLAPVVAGNIFVAPDATPARPGRLKPLTALPAGRTAIVSALDENLQGFTRRRLLDLGLTPGTSITAELPSLFGDPVAYRVRGALIALRKDQAEHILITPNGN